MSDSIYIVSVSNQTKEGVNIHLNKPAALNGGVKSKDWYLSWDKIGAALFKNYDPDQRQKDKQ